MQLDLAKAGIATYGLNRRLPTYGQPEPEPSTRTGFVRTTPHHGAHSDVQTYTILLETSAAFFVCGSCSTGLAILSAAAPTRNSVAFHPQAPSSPPTPRRQQPAQTHTSPVVLISARASDRAPTRRYLSLDLEDFQ